MVTLKTTVYRTSHDSALAPALIEAAENGKQSVCLVELKARFDERAEHRVVALARAGGRPRRLRLPGPEDPREDDARRSAREGDALRRYVHIGTGNYHATTARLYEDVGLFTADSDIAADVADLFNFVTGFGRPQEFRKLLVAPFNLRRQLVENIRAVAAAAAAGEPARIRIKVNNLTDPAIVEELYARLAGRRRDRPRRARDLHAPAGRARAQRDDPRALDPRPLPRAQPPLLLRGRRARRRTCSAAPT